MQQEQNYDPRVTGLQGGLKRAERLSAEQRRIISSIATRTRWHPEKMQAEREQAARIKRMVEKRYGKAGILRGYETRIAAVYRAIASRSAAGY